VHACIAILVYSASLLARLLSPAATIAMAGQLSTLVSGARAQSGDELWAFILHEVIMHLPVGARLRLLSVCKAWRVVDFQTLWRDYGCRWLPLSWQSGLLTYSECQTITNENVQRLLILFKPAVLWLCGLEQVTARALRDAGAGLDNLEQVAVDECPRMVLQRLVFDLPTGVLVWYGQSSIGCRDMHPVRVGYGVFVPCESGTLCRHNTWRWGHPCLVCGRRLCMRCIHSMSGACSACGRHVCADCWFRLDADFGPLFKCHECACA
jgi:hypothetical protein